MPANILDRNFVEANHQIFLHLTPYGMEYLIRQVGSDFLLGLILHIFQLAHDPRDLAEGNTPPFTRQKIAAARPAYAAQHAGMHKALHHLL